MIATKHKGFVKFPHDSCYRKKENETMTVILSRQAKDGSLFMGITGSVKK